MHLQRPCGNNAGPMRTRKLHIRTAPSTRRSTPGTFAVVKIANNPELQPSDKFNYYILDNQIPLVMIECFDDNCIKITDKMKQNKKGDQ